MGAGQAGMADDDSRKYLLLQRFPAKENKECVWRAAGGASEGHTGHCSLRARGGKSDGPVV